MLIYVVVLTAQLNLYPGERLPGWDHFWVDVRTMGRLVAVREALRTGQLPYVEHNTDFGWNLAGDHHSFWDPLNLFVLVLSPQRVIVLKEIFFLVLGSTGAFFFLRKITSNAAMSFMGAFAYVSLPFLIGLFYYEQSSYIFYALPLYLVIIMRVLERPGAGSRLVLFLYAAFAIGSSDIHALLILPVVGLLFTFGVAYQYYDIPFTRSLAHSLLVPSLTLVAGIFYILPVYANLRTIGEAAAAIRAAGIVMPPVSVDFLAFFRAYGYDSVFTPFEGSALALYIPRFFYLALILSLVLPRHVFGASARRQVMVVITLLLLGAGMLAISIAFYHPLTLQLVPALRGSARGVLRYHLNLIPFVSLLAGFVCLAGITRSTRPRLRLGGLLLIAAVAFLLDFARFGRAGESGLHIFTSSNRIPLPFGNALEILPWMNAAFVILIIAYWRAAHTPSARRHPRLLSATFVLLAAILNLANISLHNQILAQSPHRVLTRGSYRMLNFQARRTCLNRFLDADPNYRILYAGKGSISPGHGRDWKFIAETELHVEDGRKVLFPYREFVHPYVGLLRGVMDEDPGVWPSNIWPPLSRRIPSHVDFLRLMGVRYVVSADQQIEHPALIYKGQCVSGLGESSPLRWSQQGLIGFEPSLVDNGILGDSAFHTDTSGPGAYLAADTGEGRTREFVGLILTVGPKSPVHATWDVQYSDDGLTWTTVYRGAGGHPFGPGRFTYTWPSAGPRRYWRLLKTDEATVGYYHNEVEFFGPGGPGFSKYYAEDGTLYIYELADPTGIAFLTETYRPATQTEALEMIYQKTPYPWTRGPALVDAPRRGERIGRNGARSGGSTPPLAEQGEGGARIVQETYNNVLVQVATPARRLLVLSYVYTPHWRAYVDSSEVAVYRVYGGFMGVIVPPGMHTVRYTYRPVDVYAGAGLWGTGFVVLFLAAVIEARGGRSRRNAG